MAHIDCDVALDRRGRRHYNAFKRVYHLKVMLDSGLLKNQKSGQEVYYWVNCDDIVKALRGLAGAVESCCKSTDCCGVPGDEPRTKTRRMK